MALGCGSLLPLILGTFIGTSTVTPQSLKAPVELARLLTTIPATNSIVRHLQASLAPQELDVLRGVATQGNPQGPAPESPGMAVLTNLMNRALLDSSLRVLPVPPPVQARVASWVERSREHPLDLLRANREVLEDALPGMLHPGRHAREIDVAQYRFYVFLVGNLALHLCLLWALIRFLHLEELRLGEFLRGAAQDLPPALSFAIVTGMVSTLVLLVVSNLSTHLLTLLDHKPQLQQPLVILQQATGPLEKAFFGYVALVGAPFLEEVLFRGILYTSLAQRFSGRWAAAASAIVFGAIHLDLEKFIPLACFGLILVHVYRRTQTLLAPILTHATFNTINFVVFLVMDATQRGAPHATVPSP